MRTDRQGSGSRHSIPSRTACTVCRDSKTRCDRADPECGRCLRLRLRCRYNGRGTRNAQNVEMARQLEQLQERVQYAETQLVMSRTSGSPSQNLAVDHNRMAGKWSPSLLPSFQDFPLPDFQGPVSQIQASTVDILGAQDQSFHTQLGNGTTGYVLPNFDSDSHRDFDDLCFNSFVDAAVSGDNATGLGNKCLPTSLPTSNRSDGNDIQHEDLKALHRIFFDVWSPALPIIHEARFVSESTNRNPSQATRCLQYAVALIGATHCSQYVHFENRCYAISRSYLELCETSENECDIASLDAIQALILIFRYELARRRNFTRAWIALGRAIRLGKLVNLHQVDKPNQEQPAMLDLQSSLPPTLDQVTVEERRRTFWALYIFDSYASTRTGMPCQLVDAEFHVNLPCPGLLSLAFRPSPMPPISSLSLIQDASRISSWAAIILMVELAFRIFNHTRDLGGSRENKGFWDHHYHLVKDVTDLTRLLQTHLEESAVQRDSISFSLLMNISSIEILLYEAAIAEAGRQALPKTFVQDSQRSAYTASMRIATAIELIKPSFRVGNDMFFTLQAPFICWPMVMAMRALARQLENPSSNVLEFDEPQNTTTYISLLLDALDRAENHGGHWHTSTMDVAARLKEWNVTQETLSLSDILQNY